MERQPTAAFVLTLLAGLWMLGTGGMMRTMMTGFSPSGGSWMWGHPVMHGMMTPMGVGGWFPWFGAVAGIVLIAGRRSGESGKRLFYP